MKLGFIGCGNMGEAFLKGIINSEMVELNNIYVYDKIKGKEISEEKSKKSRKRRVETDDSYVKRSIE